MTFGLGKRKMLDYKRCYEMWAKQRISPYKIRHILATEGIVNLKGEPLTHQAIWRGAYLYALEHIAEAKTDAQAIASQHGIVLDETQFYKDMVNKASQFYTKKQYRAYMENHAYLKQYEK